MSMQTHEQSILGSPFRAFTRVFARGGGGGGGGGASSSSSGQATAPAKRRAKQVRDRRPWSLLELSHDPSSWFCSSSVIPPHPPFFTPPPTPHFRFMCRYGMPLFRPPCQADLCEGPATRTLWLCLTLNGPHDPPPNPPPLVIIAPPAPPVT